MEAKKIFDLPPEILLDISDHLSCVDGTCFSLCNRRLARLIGQTSWKRGSMNESELHTLTKLLAKDHPQYFACSICHKLHLLSKVDWPNMYPVIFNSGRESHCPALPKQESYPKHFLQLKDYSGFKMTLTHVQLATSGQLPVEAFRHTEVDFSGGIPHGHLGKQLFSTEARIANGELILRTQHWYTISNLYRHEIIEAGIIRCVCEHMIAMNEWRDWYWDYEYRELLKCRLKHLNKRSKIADCDYCTKLNGCGYCHMEFKIESKEIEEIAVDDDSESINANGIDEARTENETQESDSSDSEDFYESDDSDYASDYKTNNNTSLIHITRYLNLGSGQTETDQKWSNHLTEEPDSVSYERDSIRAAFDSVGGKSLEELTAENEKLLLSFEKPDNFRLSFKWTAQGIWKNSSMDTWVLISNDVRRSPRFKEQLLQSKEDEDWLRRLNSLPLERRKRGYI